MVSYLLSGLHCGQVGLGLALHEADQLIDTHGVPLDDLIAVALLLFFGIRTLQVRTAPPSIVLKECEGINLFTAALGHLGI